MRGLHITPVPGAKLTLSHRSQMAQSRTFDEIMHTWEENFEFKERDEPVKVAILDTGFDLAHPEWLEARAVGFSNGQAVREKREPQQISRVKLWKDFCTAADA